MEIINSVPDLERHTELQILPPKTHPNFRLWANYSKYARYRGELIADFIESFTPILNLEIMDLGCGDGGTTLALTERGAKVTAVDFNPIRVQKLKETAYTLNINVSILEGDAQNLSFQDDSFDWVILQDVLEHIPDPAKAAQEVRRVLRQNGSIYIATPNRWSPLNFISDPHWNLPLVSVLPRNAVVFFITKLIRREKVVRKDFAALLSLFKLRRLFESEKLGLHFINKKIVAELFIRPKAVVNRDFHLIVIKWLRKLKLEKLFSYLVNDKFGFFNYFINPTWYLIGKKFNI